MSKSWNEYYENTKSLKPSDFLIEALESFGPKSGIALDLGCGAGRDTKYLLEKGFEVKAIDKDAAAANYLKKLIPQNRLEFICTDFKDFNFSHYDLINAHYSLPFVGKDSFYNVMKKVTGSVNSEGLFVGQLFGVNDEWNTPEAKIAFCERADIDKLFSGFKLLRVLEVNEDGSTANGDVKHWHVFNIIAQK